MAGWYEENVGLAAGSLVLVAIPFPFAVWCLMAARTGIATLLLGALVVGALGMAAWAVATIGEVRRWTHGAEGDAAAGCRMKRQYWAVVGAEYVAIAMICALCGNAPQWMFIPALIDVVGRHSNLPLAWIFEVPGSRVVGVLFWGLLWSGWWWGRWDGGWCGCGRRGMGCMRCGG